MGNYIADRRLWLTADREGVVEDGDPRAAFLLASEGTEVPDEDVKRYGLKAKGKPANKEASPTADKEAAPAANKSGVTVTRNTPRR